MKNGKLQIEAGRGVTLSANSQFSIFTFPFSIASSPIAPS
jgi:hypothetical protein